MASLLYATAPYDPAVLADGANAGDRDDTCKPGACMEGDSAQSIRSAISRVMRILCFDDLALAPSLSRHHFTKIGRLQARRPCRVLRPFYEIATRRGVP